MGHELEGHTHLVSLINYAVGFECHACDRSYGAGFSCGECKFAIHMDCQYLFRFQEILDHPSHAGHCLKLLTAGAPDHTDPKCHLCSRNTKRLLYHCFDCKLNLDIDCMIDHICARAHLNMSWHHHPLIILDLGSRMFCNFCNDGGKRGYLCPRCRLVIHKGCVSVFDSPEIIHPSHVRHPLKLITNGAPDYTDRKCHVSGDNAGNLLYHCDICKFNLNMRSAVIKPTPATLSNMKVHEHTLTLMPRLISFVCDACGTDGDRSPYVCLQCDFMVHQNCAHLPRVIHVNHHDHRVSYKYPLGLRELKCGVCWEEIDWSYGAYLCSLCPCYALHSLCATRGDVWDGKELDGVREKFEDTKPFKRNRNNTITHFAHEHKLMSLNKGEEESSLCGACVRPIGSYTFYKCSKSVCSFILHETCADLSKKKRHFLSPTPLALNLYNKSHTGSCTACHQAFCKGFIYSASPWNFDLLCSSITVPFIHGSHEHHLLYLKLQYGNVKTCQSCGFDEDRVVIGCKKCDYYLDFRCATLPVTLSLPRYDDHPLTLCYGDEKASGKYWCDICERETNPKTWFYTCEDCGITLHVFCVVGDIRYAQQGGKIQFDFKLRPNNASSRPFCHECGCRCPGSFIVKHIKHDISLCSYYCFSRFQNIESMGVRTICPPWGLEPNT
ncbi:PREDICTED: uncharacterized protein LOC104710585 [Camelina sativa]|uniref:Uncharacterized protein LOC104710585 n=1 Tax=Camelina sativa TaxID=90675 RepID=A0ABM0TF77_CAMSA|nr:PREDICTED: uncharacterized protein LOC104710585 [Camelina sativa]